MEGTHGELRARFTDRLCGDDANGFAHVDRSTASKVTTVADAANADLHFAGQCRADTHGLDASLLDDCNVGFVDQRSGLDDVLASYRIVDVIKSRTAEDTCAERGNDLTGINDGGHGEALCRCRNPRS